MDMEVLKHLTFNTKASGTTTKCKGKGLCGTRMVHTKAISLGVLKMERAQIVIRMVRYFGVIFDTELFNEVKCCFKKALASMATGSQKSSFREVVRFAIQMGTLIKANGIYANLTSMERWCSGRGALTPVNGCSG